MNPYELIMRVNRKMNEDPVFAEKFNRLLGELNRTPGLQQEIMRIAQIQDERKRQKQKQIKNRSLRPGKRP